MLLMLLMLAIGVSGLTGGFLSGVSLYFAFLFILRYKSDSKMARNT